VRVSSFAMRVTPGKNNLIVLAAGSHCATVNSD
jgi:hypothetical protein